MFRFPVYFFQNRYTCDSVTVRFTAPAHLRCLDIGDIDLRK